MSANEQQWCLVPLPPTYDMGLVAEAEFVKSSQGARGRWTWADNFAEIFAQMAKAAPQCQIELSSDTLLSMAEQAGLSASEGRPVSEAAICEFAKALTKKLFESVEPNKPSHAVDGVTVTKKPLLHTISDSQVSRDMGQLLMRLRDLMMFYTQGGNNYGRDAREAYRLIVDALGELFPEAKIEGGDVNPFKVQAQLDAPALPKFTGVLSNDESSNGMWIEVVEAMTVEAAKPLLIQAYCEANCVDEDDVTLHMILPGEVQPVYWGPGL